MCGIIGQAGNLNSGQLPLEELFHRGPDANGTWSTHRNGEYVAGFETGTGEGQKCELSSETESLRKVSKGCVLGHTRLSIIDLDPRANQPMIESTGRYVIVLNGEIYNYRELRKVYLAEESFQTSSDTEVLLLLWRKFGAGCLNYLYGMFAFAIWDNQEQQLFLARDRFGKKPLFYNVNNHSGTFTFASELNALSKFCSSGLSINPAAVDLFFGYQFVPAPHTIFQNTYKLLPGHFGLWKNKDFKEFEYWRMEFPEKVSESISETQAMEQFETGLKEAVQFRLRADVQVGCLLSGGVDSSLITAIASQILSRPLKTFSIGFNEPQYNELPFAGQVAKICNTEHHSIMFSPIDAADYFEKSVQRFGEPFGDKSSLPSLLLCEKVSKFVKVALNGDGGDELFAGYPKYFLSLFQTLMGTLTRSGNLFGRRFEDVRALFSPSSLVDAAIRRSKREVFDPLSRIFHYEEFVRRRDRRALYNPDFLHCIPGEPRFAHEDLLLKQTDFSIPPLSQLLSLDYRHYLANDLLVKMDISSMASSLEVRSPFLDHQLMELIAQFPTTLKIKHQTGKYLLKKLAEKYFPREIIYRPKKGFSIPVAEWLRGPLNHLLKDILSDASHQIWNFLRRQMVKTWLDQHEARQVNHGGRLWLILVFAIWAKNRSITI